MALDYDLLFCIHTNHFLGTNKSFCYEIVVYFSINTWGTS